ncbi:a-factor receptor [Malassezia caprae]|uniref:A-factor receptor n=1 Tax=Malassezia caprae TaxID=1381934 RepID=A0AAF0E449_9BASI|nr:a-factor receptor [Malassezia caprae]
MSGFVTPIIAILAVIVSLLPVASHWRARNFVILGLALWIVIGNINIFVNRIIWMSNAENSAPIWCDFSVKLMSMASFSLPCSSLLISSKLYDIASLKYSKKTTEEKRRQLILELFCITVLPIIYSLLTLVSQGHRFNIVYGRGCEPAVYFSSVSIVIDYGIPVLICISSLIYSVLSLRHFFIHKKDFDAVLSKSGSGISTKKFIRMISFALIDLLINFPILLAAFALEISYMKVLPYTSWNFVHRRFSDVWIYPRVAISNTRFKHFLIMTSFATWSQCMMGFVFFFMFGLGADMKTDYIRSFNSLKGMLRVNKEKQVQKSEDGNLHSLENASNIAIINQQYLPIQISSLFNHQIST